MHRFLLRYINISLFIIISTINIKVFAQSNGQTYTSRPFIKELRSLKVTRNGIFDAAPMIEINGEDKVQIDFDIIGDDEKWIGYRIYHLDHLWRKSNISQQEYFDGFDNNQLDFSENSFNTYVNYRHYSIEIPNENFNLTKSGNYVIEFFEVNEPETIIATACFSIYEQKVDISVNISGNTDIDYNKEHQQLTTVLNIKDNTITNPVTDLFIVVTQNGRRDMEKVITTPSRFSANKVYYEHNRDLIFPGGNNYRRFDISDSKYASMGVERIRYYEPLYYAFLFPDIKRFDQPFSYDSGQKGKYIIRNVSAEDNDVEADYFNVLFSFESTFPITAADLYISGEFTNDRFDESNKMDYNEELRRYEKDVLLKQGHYNYIYVVKSGNKPATTALTEGNFFETPNSYTVKVFYRKPGERYDKLIGIFYN